MSLKQILTEKTVRLIELQKLLASNRFEYNYFALSYIQENDIYDACDYIEKFILQKAKNGLLLAEGLDTLLELDEERALVYGRKLYDHKNRFVQSSALYIIGECGDKKDLTGLCKIKLLYGSNNWRLVGILEAMSKIDTESRLEYIMDILGILESTKSYQTQCSVLNTLSRILVKE